MTTPSTLDQLIRPVGTLEPLDRLAALLDRGAAGLGRLGPTLRGQQLGHALHPVMTDLPIGFWTSAMTLDLVGGRRSRPAATTLTGWGVACAPLAFVTGLAEFATIDDRSTRRVAAAHWLANSAATATYLLSWRSRRAGHTGRGITLGFAGGTIATVAGMIGGHLAFGGSDDAGPVADAGDEHDTGATGDVTPSSVATEPTGEHS